MYILINFDFQLNPSSSPPQVALGILFHTCQRVYLCSLWIIKRKLLPWFCYSDGQVINLANKGKKATESKLLLKMLPNTSKYFDVILCVQTSMVILRILEQQSLTQERNKKKVQTEVWAFKPATFKIAIKFLGLSGDWVNALKSFACMQSCSFSIFTSSFSNLNAW